MTDNKHAQSRKDALFKMSNRTLAATDEWRLVIRVGLVVAIASVCYNFYWMELTNEKKALGLIGVLFSCYAAVNLASTVRSRDEAIKLENFAKDTNLYSVSTVKTLRGSNTKYAFQYLGFIVAFVVMIASIYYVDMPAERRGNFLSADMLLLIMSFLTQKDIRDKEDADKLYTEYCGQEYDKDK